MGTFSGSTDLSSGEVMRAGKKMKYVSVNGGADAVPHENEHGRESYVITLHDNATDADFENLKNWMTGKSIAVTESTNESYIKYVVAALSRENVEELQQNKEKMVIETVELDDLEWRETEHSEL